MFSSWYYSLVHAYRTIRSKSYRVCLRKAIKGDRTPDYDYFAWSFDTNLVEALSHYIDRARDERWVDFDADYIQSLCKEYLKIRHERDEKSTRRVKEIQREL